jgi:hypothetical protein
MEVLLFVIYIHCVFCDIGKEIKKNYCYQIVSLGFAYYLILGNEELCYFTVRIKIWISGWKKNRNYVKLMVIKFVTRDMVLLVVSVINIK